MRASRRVLRPCALHARGRGSPDARAGGGDAAHLRTGPAPGHVPALRRLRRQGAPHATREGGPRRRGLGAATPELPLSPHVSRRAHVAVVGGGFAGLAAAVRLAGAGARVTLLERRPFLGGRAYSFTDPVTGDVVDNGPHAFMGAYVETIDFLREIGTVARLAFGARLSVTLADPARGCARIAAPPLPGPLQAPAALLRYGHLSSSDRARLLLGALRLARRSPERLRGETVAQALAGAGQGAEARYAFWDPLVIATMNEVPEVAAAAPFVAVVRQGFLSGARAARFALASVPLSELYVPDATRAITAGGVVRSGARVAEVVCGEDRASGVRLQDGETIAADAVILAVPVSALWRMVPEAFAAASPLRALADLDTSPIVSVHCWLDRAVG